ncbi:MAG: futalosine hydrolase [Planctomycetes bacterium]|nr:futalosine hydrolase [Planctomycetota bacterium]
MPAPLGSPTLVLIPTAVERRRIEDHGSLESASALISLCGFGPIAAAARTAELLATLRPARVLLVGICGTFDAERLPVGSAVEFDAVAIEGIGAGEGATLMGPTAMGFPQWPGGEAGDSQPIHDRIVLAGRSALADASALRDPARAALLLTTCAASASPEQAALRRARFPEALAEDMEGFAVALACALAEVPLSIVRGVSNVVGDRDPANWRIPSALGAARLCALEVLRSSAIARAPDRV